MTEEEKKTLEQEVEKTIGEMKQKAADLLKTAESINDFEVGAMARELAAKVSESFEKTSAKLTESLHAAADPEQVRKTIEYVRAKTDEIGGYASGKLEELKKSDTVHVENTFEQKPENGTVETVKETALKVGEKINEGLDQLKRTEAYRRVNEGFDTLKNSDPYKRVADKVTDVTGSAREAFTNFAEKNDLDIKLDRAKDTAIELAEKGVSALKRWLKPELYGRNKEDKE
ncbi:MAG: hypothetical protein K6D92_03650 [Erysipelotrichaceae bacterium]|nr:hypothetical protein [Erysipelotrichaceae bacterium]